MLLRDDYRSLDDLCDDMNVDRNALEMKLAAVGFEYSEKNNKFW
ncbi:PF14056 domain protein [Prevotella sp. MSX73]|nr:PF14056 domain protein [Prevotella sp. MSX73]